MSVIHCLENYERRHQSPDDDKAGWKRLVRGAVSKAAGLLWSAGGSVDVTLGPSSGNTMDQLPNSTNFSDIQSPKRDAYLSVSHESDSSEELFLSLDESSSIRMVPVSSTKCPTPKSHSTPYKDKNSKSSTSAGEGSKENPFTIQVDKKRNVLDEVSTSADDISLREKGQNIFPGYQSYDLAQLCSEMERLSLKKIIVEIEKSITAEIREEFDLERRKIEDHDKKVSEILAREKEEKEMEDQLIEMNWFQRIRESQLQVEQDLNSKLDLILAKGKKNEADKSVLVPSNLRLGETKGGSDQKDSELDLVVKKRALIETISKTQKNYNFKYNDLLQLLQSSRVSLLGKFYHDFETLKKNNARLTDVICKSKCGNVAQADVDECIRLFTFLSDLYDKIKIKIEEYETAQKLEEEANAKLEEALKKNAENAKSIAANAKSIAANKVIPPVKEEVEEKAVSAFSECSQRRLDRVSYYNYVTKQLEKAEDSLKGFLNDDKYKTFRKDCQRAVNVPVNAISPTSSSHLMDKFNKLADLLNGKIVPVMSREFYATLHPMGIIYCQVLLARKIVKAGEDVVSSHPETGHAIASVVQSLTIRFPLLTVYLHAFFFRICPYLVPLDLKPLKHESNLDYNKRLGFNYENDEKEDTDKFLKRMSGVAQLYSAIVIAQKRRDDFGLHAPLGVSDIWVWLTNFTSIEPISDISATILLDILEVSGHYMLTCYGYHFQKLLYLICTDYLKKIDEVTEKGRGGPVKRLQTFLENVIKVKRIFPPKGVLPPQFW